MLATAGGTGFGGRGAADGVSNPGYMKTLDPSRTADGFARKGAFAVAGGPMATGGDATKQGGRKKNFQETLDVDEDNASVGGKSANDNVSAGGSRYVVGLKGGFYGGASGSQLDAQSAHSNNNPADGDFVADRGG